VSFSDTSYFQVPEDNECILNAVQLGKLIDEPATTIRSWADKHDKYLYIKKVNDRFVYTQASIEQFKFIKDLCRNKNFTHKQITDHIKQHGFEYSKYDSGLVDIKDPLGYQALASALALENQKQLKQFLTDFVQYQEESHEKLIESVKTEVEQTVQEQLEESMSGIQKELELQREENKKLSNQIDDMHREIAVTNDLNNRINHALENMEQRKKEFEEKQEPKSIFSKIFNFKK